MFSVAFNCCFCCFCYCCIILFHAIYIHLHNLANSLFFAVLQHKKEQQMFFLSSNIEMLKMTTMAESAEEQ